MNRYATAVFWSYEDSAWFANVPGLKYCSERGDLPEKAVTKVQIAMETWLDATREAGHPISEPRFQPQ